MTVTPLRPTDNPASIESLAIASLPRNLEAEQALLGALLLDNALIEDVQLKLRPEHFSEDIHGRLYAAILQLATTHKQLTVTPITLKPMFERDAALAELGGMAYVAALTQNPAMIGARAYAEQIYDLALLRELIRVGRTMVETAMDTSQEIDPQAQIEAAEMALYAIAEKGDVSSGQKSFGSAASAAVAMIERARKSGSEISGITTGLNAINNMLGGLQRSDLIILAGRPGMGKTALATNMAFAAALRFKQDMELGLTPLESIGAPVAFFSLEMSADQLAARVLAEQSDIPSENLRMGKLGNEEFRRLARAAADLHDLPLIIDDTAGLSIAAVRTRARRLKRKGQLGMIVVDYLQLLQGSARNGDNRVQEISEITRGLKQLAKELNVPVLALSQLSRAVESREDKRPQLSDLRESGTIEQDADSVMFVFREDYYHAQRKPEDGSEKFDSWLERGAAIRGQAEVIVAKNRHGATGNVGLMFKKETTKFSDRPVGDDYLPERM
jgi:replicative DNA helicase